MLGHCTGDAGRLLCRSNHNELFLNAATIIFGTDIIMLNRGVLALTGVA